MPIIKNMTNIIQEQVMGITAEYLTQTANDYFYDFLATKKSIDDMQSDMDELKRLYNCEKSYFTQLCEWFNSNSWYETAELSVLFVLGSSLVGACLNMAILFGAVSIIIFYLATSILMQHYLITSERERCLFEGINDLQIKLAESIDYIAEIIIKLQDMQKNLFLINIQAEESINYFKDHVSTLDKQIEILVKNTLELNQAQDALMQENKKLNEQLSASAQEISDANATIKEQTRALSDVRSQFEDTNRHLLAKNDEIKALHAGVQLHIEQMGELEKAYKDHLSFFQADDISCDKIVPAAEGDCLIIRASKRHCY